MRTEFLCISVLGVASGPRVKLASCKSALTKFYDKRVDFNFDIVNGCDVPRRTSYGVYISH